MTTDISTGESIKENIKYSLSVLSISGFSYTSYDTKRSIFERIFWILAIIAMIALATWQGLIVYTHYKERPVIVTVDKSYFDWKLVFPTLTLCLEELKSKKELQQVIRNLITKHNLSEDLLSTQYVDFINYLRDLAFKNYTSYVDYESYFTGEKKEYLKPEQYMEVLDQVVFIFDSAKITSGRPKALPISFPLNNSRPVARIFTEWGPCMVANPNISIYFTPQYFNSTEPYQEYKPIHYTVNTMASMTIKTPSKEDIYVYFHAPNEIMDITDRKYSIQSSYYLMSKYETEIVVSSEDVGPLSVKQKKCRLPYELNEEPLLHSPVYSYNLCKIECRIKIALLHCNCTPYYYRRLANEPICNLTGLYCLSKYRDRLTSMSNSSDNNCLQCPQNCDVTLVRQFEILQSHPFLQTTLEMFVIFPKNIYVRNLIFSKIDLTVQIGGIFGLFLGCSLLSVVEIIYSFSLRLICGVRDRNKFKNKP